MKKSGNMTKGPGPISRNRRFRNRSSARSNRRRTSDNMEANSTEKIDLTNQRECGTGLNMAWKQWVTSGGAVALAFLASQHHNLHMLLFVLGLSSAAGMNLLTAFPILRRGMLLMSLLMTALTFYIMMRHKQPRVTRIMSALSIPLSLGLILWTVYQFGL